MKYLKNKQGFVMVMVIMLMATLVILSSTIIFIANNAVLRSHKEEEAMQAYYLARTGAEAAVSAWLQKGASNKPVGEIKRVYFNVESGDFQTNVPAKSGGYFEAKIEEPVGDKDPWRIISTGVVGKYSKTVSLITYSFSNDPGWYTHDGGNGIINNGEHEFYDEEIVYLSLDQGKIFKPNNLDQRTGDGGTIPVNFEGSIEAETIIFANPLKIDLGNVVSNKVSNPENKKLIVSAERIVFDDVEVSFAPKGSGRVFLIGKWEREALRGELILKVPEGKGIPGNDSRINGKATDKYGEVYFEGKDLKKQNYKWYADWLIVFTYHIKPDGVPSQIKYNGKDLAGNAFYFKNNTNLLEPKAGDFVLMDDEDEMERPSLKGVKPYYWE